MEVTSRRHDRVRSIPSVLVARTLFDQVGLPCGSATRRPSQETDGRLREAERELSAARRLLREAGAERELLRNRLEEARKETEELIQATSQVPRRITQHLYQS